jgi:hypothetical protein
MPTKKSRVKAPSSSVSKTSPKVFVGPVLDSAEQKALVEAAVANAVRLSKVELITIVVPPLLFNGVFSLAPYQTPFGNQGDRGTCWAFAGVAALEAAYRRKFGVTIDASEEYTFHMGKSFALNRVAPGGLALPIENNSSLIGFQGSGDVVEKLTECAVPGADTAPYLTSQQALLDILTTLGYSGVVGIQTEADLAALGFSQEDRDALEFCEQHIPLRARVNARYRAAGWGSLGINPLVSDLEKILLSYHEIVCDVTHLTPPQGGHVLLLIGFDRNRQVFQAKNSWGENAFIEIKYANDPNWTIDSGFFIKDVLDSTYVQSEACWVGNWWVTYAGGTSRLLIRRSEDFANPGKPTKLGTFYADGNKYDVNGGFANNGMTVQMYVAPSTAPVLPGTLAGARIDAHLNLSDIYNANGTDGLGQPLTLSRFSTRFAAIWEPDQLPWVARHGIDSATYQNLVDTLGPQGYRPLHICGYSEGRDARFATVWSKVDGPPWVARHNLTSAEYQSAFDSFTSVGYRPISISGYAIDGQARYAGIWELRDGPVWVARHGLTRDQFQQTFSDLPPQGYVPVQVGGYRVNVEVLFTALWQRLDNIQWEAHHAMTTLEYQKKFDQMQTAGKRLVWVNGYSDTGIARYAAIWYQAQPGAWQARHGLDSAQYQQTFDQLAAQGLRPVQISGYGDGFYIA